MAEVNDKGEVTVEGEFVGRLEGFLFRQDGTGSPDEAKTLRQAAYEALRPEFSLRSDRFYNAPDTEFDYTEQGGLMWGTTAVGKLVKGPDALRPLVEAFVDEEAGQDVADKVRRRLQHFIDRKVAALFDPPHALSRDESMQGLARGVAFRLVEAMGVMPREPVADDVKALDQEARSALRKHGVRFGQYTIFLPPLLKPAPTRLRMVLWSLWDGLQEFPESPPPGLVTIPHIAEVPALHYTLAGYRPAGTRAIRIDMLERLADLLRAKDSRAGFEATPDMLSITGMTLDQFADLMGGLGYKGEKAERPKVRPVAEAAPVVAAGADADADAEGAVAEPAAPAAVADAPAEAAPDVAAPEAAAAGPVETETFYTFVWAPRPRGGAPRGDRGPRRDGAPQGREGQRGPRDGQRGPREGHAPRAPRGDQPAPGSAPADAPVADGTAQPARADRGPRPDRKEFPRKDAPRKDSDRRDGDRKGGKPFGGKPEGKREDRGHGDRPDRVKGGKPEGKRNDGPRNYEARPPREQAIDPDNPFAALLALKGKV